MHWCPIDFKVYQQLASWLMCETDSKTAVTFRVPIAEEVTCEICLKEE
jgi:hypothetical protein